MLAIWSLKSPQIQKCIRAHIWGHVGRAIREGNGTPLQYSRLENLMDGGAWWAAVHGVANSRTRLSDFTFTFLFHALEKEMTTHSSVLAWRIPGTGEPGGLLSMGSHRVRHDWSDLAAAAGRAVSGRVEMSKRCPCMPAFSSLSTLVLRRDFNLGDADPQGSVISSGLSMDGVSDCSTFKIAQWTFHHFFYLFPCWICRIPSLS